MRLVIQRVKSAKVAIGGKVVAQIGTGMLVFIGVAKEDSEKDVDFLVSKITQLRIFEDANGKMNLSIREVGGDFLVVSQFTLLGDCGQGRRPSFDAAAAPEKGEALYNRFVTKLSAGDFKVETGQFRARMDVSLVNDGPVTFVIESKS